MPDSTSGVDWGIASKVNANPSSGLDTAKNVLGLGELAARTQLYSLQGAAQQREFNALQQHGPGAAAGDPFHTEALIAGAPDLGGKIATARQGFLGNQEKAWNINNQIQSQISQYAQSLKTLPDEQRAAAAAGMMFNAVKSGFMSPQEYQNNIAELQRDPKGAVNGFIDRALSAKDYRVTTGQEAGNVATATLAPGLAKSSGEAEIGLAKERQMPREVPPGGQLRIPNAAPLPYSPQDFLKSGGNSKGTIGPQSSNLPATSDTEPSPRLVSAAQRLMQGGQSLENTAAILGRATVESGKGNLDISPTAYNPDDGKGGPSVGSIQWHADRIPKLAQFARDQRGNIPRAHLDQDTQMDFVNHELNTSEAAAKDRLDQAPDIESKAAAVNHYFRPGGFSPDNPQGANNWKQQVANTQKIYDYLKSNPNLKPVSADGSTPAPTWKPDSIVGDSIAKLVDNHANVGGIYKVGQPC